MCFSFWGCETFGQLSEKWKKAPDRHREAFFAKVYMKRKLFQFYGELLQVFVGGTAPDKDLILSRLGQYITAGTIVECECFGCEVERYFLCFSGFEVYSFESPEGFDRRTGGITRFMYIDLDDFHPVAFSRIGDGHGKAYIFAGFHCGFFHLRFTVGVRGIAESVSERIGVVFPS